MNPEYPFAPTAHSAVNPYYYEPLPVLNLYGGQGRGMSLTLPAVAGNELVWIAGALVLGIAIGAACENRRHNNL